MSSQEVRVPDIGGFSGVEVIEVLVAPGATVAVEDSLITLESDKATMDVPSPVAGTVREVHLAVGAKVSEGDLVATVEVAGDAGAAPAEGAREHAGAGEGEREGEGEAPPPADAPAGEEPAEEASGDTGEAEAAATEPARETPAGEATGRASSAPVLTESAPSTGRSHASPAVRAFARELGVDLAGVSGSGRKGRVTREDVQRHVKTQLAGGGGGALPPMPVIDFAQFGPVDREPLSRIERRSGPNLHRSWLHVPHVTQHDEADVTELEAFRTALKPEAERRELKLTPVAFVLQAVAAALKAHPRVNASLDPDGEHVILKRYIHIGVAVDTPDGLVVPVVRDVDRKGVWEIAADLLQVSGAARAGKLKLDQLQGASFTVTSLGGIGGTAFTPIVNAPEAAILGLSKNRWQPVWNGERFEPRLMLPLSLSYDHRLIDGALAARFTSTLAALLGDLRRLLL